MLAVKNLEVVYQDVILVLRGISFEIPKGEIVSLLGSNGSGKTTVLRAITGLLDTQNGDITKGQIFVEDEEITNADPSKIVNLGIAQVLEGRRIFSELSVSENLRLGGFTNDSASGENMIYAEADAGANLYHNALVKLATSATGVTVTGDATATSFIGVSTGGTASGATVGVGTTATILGVTDGATQNRFSGILVEKAAIQDTNITASGAHVDPANGNVHYFTTNGSGAVSYTHLRAHET